MNLLANGRHLLQEHILLLAGIIIIIAFYSGRGIRTFKLPSLIGFILLGVVMGPSLLHIINDPVKFKLSFITDIALGFVALSIGIELSFTTLKRFGWGIISVILVESLAAFIVVLAGVYFLTGDLALALIFAAIAPASAPAGTVAIIHEYRAKGPLTKALYAVVGFDDGLGVIIFGFAAAIARSILLAETGTASPGFIAMMQAPFLEIILGLVVGITVSWLFSLLARRLSETSDVAILVFGMVLLLTGICQVLHLSLILTNMVAGLLIVNTQPERLISNIKARLPDLMPLLFILFFTLAGANLHISQIPALGILGVVYMITRTTGLMGGSYLGALIGKADPLIRKYVGMGILSQAGLAIGLALIVVHEFGGLGALGANGMTHGARIGATVLTTITATCIIFEIVGPILTKIALKKAGEIQ